MALSPASARLSLPTASVSVVPSPRWCVSVPAMNYDRGQQSYPILGSLKTTGWIVRHGEESTPVAACQTVRRYYTMTAASVEQVRGRADPGHERTYGDLPVRSLQ